MSLRLAGVVAPGGRDGKRGGQGSVVLGFGYTPKMQRASMSNSSAGVVQGSTYYLGFDALTHGELRIAGAAPKTAPPAWVDYLHVGGRLVGAFSTMCGASPCVKPGSGFNITAMSHAAFGTGQLASVAALTGSVAAASATPNGWGSLPAAIGNGPAGQYYDPWGARRIAVPAPAPPPGSIASSEHRRFIGEEHLDSFGLINLNRRLYDPHIGRFLAADPIAQGFFADPQGLNRYSYAGNMPLNASDPSGFVNIVVGGFFDSVSHIMMKLSDKLPDLQGYDGTGVRYFSYDDAAGIADAIASTPPGERITVIAHSWGNFTPASDIVQAIKQGLPNRVTFLSLDPVDNSPGGLAIAGRPIKNMSPSEFTAREAMTETLAKDLRVIAETPGDAVGIAMSNPFGVTASDQIAAAGRFVGHDFDPATVPGAAVQPTPFSHNDTTKLYESAFDALKDPASYNSPAPDPGH